MNIHEFGEENTASLVMIHGACMAWDMFQESIDILKQTFHVYAVAVPGHDPETEEEFTSVEEIADRIETELIARGGQEIDILYGLSMGGGFVIRMLADNRLRVKHAVIDAGITPYELPYPVTRLLLVRDFLMIEWGKHSKKALALAFPPDEYGEEGIDYMYQVMRHMSARTIRNVFDSTDNYAMPERFPEIPTTIEYWYGEREKKARKLDIEYVKKHIPHVRFREIPLMDHGQYVLTKPKEFAEDILKTADSKTLEKAVYLPLQADYKNWVPKGMIYGFAAGTAAFAAAYAGVDKLLKDSPAAVRMATKAIVGMGLLGCGVMTAWSAAAHQRFSYDGKRKLSRQIVEGTAEYVTLPEGGIGLDVGCGSGALTIACAKRNPQGSFVGVDRWGKEYASFSKGLCENNAEAEGVTNVSFQSGNAVSLDFADETFDAVTSNYVYHNITGANKQRLLSETLRVLKKGGTFAIHDLMSKGRYGDMQRFVEKLRAEGYEEVRMIVTDNGKFMSKTEATLMMLTGSCLLVGRK